jgi:4-aminobutyrate aminotransferase-like enzyme
VSEGSVVTDALSVLGQNSALAETLATEALSMTATIAGEIGITVARAEGCHVIDEDGRSYLDLTAGSGVLALGHCDPDVRAAMHEQIDLFVHGGWQFASPSRARLTRMLCEMAPWPDAAVLVTTSGSEAVETALKVARAATGRRQVLGFLGGYHGKTAGSLDVTAHAPFRMGVTDRPVATLSLPYPAAMRYVEPDESHMAGLDFGQAILEHPDFGRAAVAALMVEAVQGAGGMTAAVPGLLSALRSFTERHGMLLIIDEIFTGFGRTGAMWGFEHDGVVPDLIVIGKAMGGGLPIGAVLGPRSLLDTLAPLKQTSTFSGNPVACAAGAVTLAAIRDRGLNVRAAKMGLTFAHALAAINIDGVHVCPVGRGLMVGARLDVLDSQASAVVARNVIAEMRARGVLALRGGPDGNIIKVTPPLTVPDDALDQAAAVFEESIRAALQ